MEIQLLGNNDFEDYFLKCLVFYYVWVEGQKHELKRMCKKLKTHCFVRDHPRNMKTAGPQINEEVHVLYGPEVSKDRAHFVTSSFKCLCFPNCIHNKELSKCYVF